MAKCACAGIKECRKFADIGNPSHYILASSDKGRVGHLDGLCGKQVVKGRRLCSTCCKRTAAQKKMMSGGMQQQTQANAAVLDVTCTDGKTGLESELSCDDLDVLPTAGCRTSVAPNVMILDSPKEPILRKRVKMSTIRDNVYGDDIHHLEDYAIDIYKQMNKRICRRDVCERTKLNVQLRDMVFSLRATGYLQVSPDFIDKELMMSKVHVKTAMETIQLMKDEFPDGNTRDKFRPPVLLWRWLSDEDSVWKNLIPPHLLVLAKAYLAIDDYPEFMMCDLIERRGAAGDRGKTQALHRDHNGGPAKSIIVGIALDYFINGDAVASLGTRIYPMSHLEKSMDVYLEKTVPDEDLPASCITVSSPVILFDDYIIHGSGALPDNVEKDYTRIFITLGNETDRNKKR